MSTGDTAPERFPITEIPDSLICPLCDTEVRSFDTPRAFRGHMAAKHRVLYELDPAGEEAAARFANAVDTEDITKLKPYMALAIARHEVYGEAWDAVAEVIGKSANHLSKCASSPAGREFSAQLTDMMGDAKSVVKMLMESATLQMYMDWMAALEWAKGARDFKAVHTMLKDVGLQPVLKDLERDAAPQTLTISIVSGKPEIAAQTFIGAGAPARVVTDSEYVLED